MKNNIQIDVHGNIYIGNCGCGSKFKEVSSGIVPSSDTYEETTSVMTFKGFGQALAISMVGVSVGVATGGTLAIVSYGLVGLGLGLLVSDTETIVEIREYESEEPEALTPLARNGEVEEVKNLTPKMLEGLKEKVEEKLKEIDSVVGRTKMLEEANRNLMAIGKAYKEKIGEDILDVEIIPAISTTFTKK